MSWTEVNHIEGQNFGGMPYDAILSKLEETDPDLVADVRGFDQFRAVEDSYGDYVRSEIIDWAPDTPYLESDQPRRDPGWSRSVLNLHYNGTRGSNPELPRHPELFYGFTGNDPRGVVNDPRFDEVRGHISSRAADLAVRMGNNDDSHICERPWTNQSISYGMKELHRRVQQNTKVFTVSKEGRPWGNNIMADDFAAGDVRAFMLGGAGESVACGAERFVGAGGAPVADTLLGDARGLAVPAADAAPWRHAVGDADLGVQRYGQARGAGRGVAGPGAVGGGLACAGGADQDWAESRRAQGANRQVLGATMALAARFAGTARAGAHDTDPGASYEGARALGAALAPTRDVARAYYAVAEDQDRRPASGVQDGDGGRLGGARGLTPAAQPGHAARATEAAATQNGHLTNAAAIVTGLREGSAAARRRIAGLVVADGAHHRAGNEATGVARRGAVPLADGGAAGRMSDMPLARSAAAALEVHAYRGAAPAGPDPRAAHARRAYDPSTWYGSHVALPFGASAAPGQWRSATQDQATIGDAADRVFGFDAEVVAGHGAAATGPKRLRSGAWSDGAGLADDFGDRGLGVGA